MKDKDNTKIKCVSCGELHGSSFFEKWDHTIRNHMDRKQ
jgi:hypothetical protein